MSSQCELMNTKSKSLSKGKVLVIDDHESTRDFMGEALTCMGYTPLLAEEGNEGLALCQKEDVQVVLVDYILPHMSGLEVAEKIKALPKKLPVVLTSASYVDAASDMKGKKIDYFLNKPFRLAELELVIQKAIGQGGGRI